MPIYEYRCEECGKTLEILQSMAAGSEGLTCPACGSERLSKAFSTFAATTASPAGAAAGGGGGGGCGSGFT